MTARSTRRCKSCKTQGARRLTGYHKECRKSGSLVPKQIEDSHHIRHGGGVEEFKHSPLTDLLNERYRATEDVGDRNEGRRVDIDAIASDNLLGIGWRPLGHGGDLVDEHDAARVEDETGGRRQRVLDLLNDDRAALGFGPRPDTSLLY